MKKATGKKPKKLFFCFLFFSFSFIILFSLFYFSLRNLPSPKQLSVMKIPQTTKIYDRDGVLLYGIYATQNRTVVPLTKVPLRLRQATIAIEDKDFYKHRGFDLRGIARALGEILFHGKLQGGSTITQQLVKNTLLSPERTLKRKIREWVLSFLIERKYTKDQILEMYLNQVPYGGTAYGVEAGAELYFGKKVWELTLGESALLAGLPGAPTFYSPFGAYPERAKNRQQEVLRRMTEDGYINEAQARQVIAKKLQFAAQKTDIKAPHFVMYIKDLLVKKYGEKTVEQGGLKVTTTLDFSLQEYVQATVASEIKKLKDLWVSNGAVLVTKPSTGEILSMVGSKDYFATDSGNVNVTLSLRQPGSAIKPINYAAGLAKKIITPASVFLDIPSCFPNPPHKPYCPNNYDGRFHGAVQTRFALGNSYNMPAVKMLKINTVRDMLATASSMGISTLTDESRYGLSLTLGGGEVSMLDMATAFGIFANTGIRKDLTAILKVEDSQGKILEENKFNSQNINPRSRLLIEGSEVLPAEVAYLISHILLDNNARSGAFGANSELLIKNHPAVSVKTGTTDDKRDNWTIGYTPSFLTVVWVGNNDNSAMHPYLSSGITGAAPIWNKIMTRVLENENPKKEWPIVPENIVGREICSLSGKLPDNSDCPKRYEYFIRGTEPKETDDSRKKVFIDVTTGNLAKPGQTENVAEQEHLVITDVTGQTFCVTCPINANLSEKSPANP